VPSQPTPKPPATVRLAGLTRFPVEADASRRDALRVVNENLRAAERFALTGAPLSVDAAIAAIEAGLAMVPQPVQQQQAKARETAAEWGARILTKHPTPAPRPVREDSPAIKAGLAIAAEAGRRYAEAQNAVRAELDITAAPARAGRYGKAA
jgi:hypothetical protein